MAKSKASSVETAPKDSVKKAPQGRSASSVRKTGAAARSPKAGPARKGATQKSKTSSPPPAAAASANGSAERSRLERKYHEQVKPVLLKSFSYSSSMQVPRFVKLTLNMGIGEATTNPKLIESAISDLSRISGQRPVLRRARKSIAAFKLREGMPVGVMLTLRRARMWHFLDKLISVALPQVRDFRGLPRKSFDGSGNFTLGIREQLIFPEISYDDIDQLRGMNLTIHTTAKTDAEALVLLEQIGLPFRRIR